MMSTANWHRPRREMLDTAGSDRSPPREAEDLRTGGPHSSPTRGRPGRARRFEKTAPPLDGPGLTGDGR